MLHGVGAVAAAQHAADSAVVGADVHHGAVHAFQAPLEIVLRQLRQSLAQQGRKAFGSLVVGGKHHLPDCLVGIDRAQGRDAVEVGLALAVGGAQRRGDEGPKNVLHGGLRRLLLQPLQQCMALSVDGHHALLEQGL